RRDRPLDELVPLARLGDVVPHLEAVGLLLRQDDQTVLVLPGLEEDVDLVPRLDGGPAAGRLELRDRDLTFRLVPDVDDDVVLGHLDDCPGDDLPFLADVVLEALLEELGETFLLAPMVLYLHAFGCFLSLLCLGAKAEAGNSVSTRVCQPPFSRARIMCSISDTTSSGDRWVESTLSASGACRRGAVVRVSSRWSLTIMSARTVVSSMSTPAALSSIHRRWARTSGAAVKKNFAAASGNTTVPASRPSTTTPPDAPMRRCSSRSAWRTSGSADTRDAPSEMSGSRTAADTSSPPISTRFFMPSMRKSTSSAAARAPSAGPSSHETPFRRAASATAR